MAKKYLSPQLNEPHSKLSLLSAGVEEQAVCRSFYTCGLFNYKTPTGKQVNCSGFLFTIFSIARDVCETCDSTGFTKEYDVVFPGDLSDTFRANSWSECVDKCAQEPKCAVVSFTAPRRCEIKYKFQLSGRNPTKQSTFNFYLPFLQCSNPLGEKSGPMVTACRR